MRNELETFDMQGNFNGTLPQECIEDCSQSGDNINNVMFWCDKLDWYGLFDSHSGVRALARTYLREFGAWEDLDCCDSSILAERVLWLACGVASEQGEWFGMVN